MKRVPLVLALLLLISGCGSEKSPQEQGINSSIYFVADTPRGFKLYSEMREFPETGDVAEKVISDLVSGELVPLDPDYATLWGPANSLNSIAISMSVATIDLKAISLNVGAEAEQRAIDQIVWTYLGLNDEVDTVRFTVNGDTVESFAGHVDTTGDFTRAPDYEVLNPLQISSMNEGDSISSPVEISGQACTFEANVVWRLTTAGKVVEESFTTAVSACPERSAWSVSLKDLAPGAYTFEALEYSAEDGSLSAIDDKNFVVK